MRLQIPQEQWGDLECFYEQQKRGSGTFFSRVCNCADIHTNKDKTPACALSPGEAITLVNGWRKGASGVLTLLCHLYALGGQTLALPQSNGEGGRGTVVVWGRTQHVSSAHGTSVPGFCCKYHKIEQLLTAQ